MVIVLKHKRNKQKKQDRIEDINKTLFDNGASDIIKNRDGGFFLTIKTRIHLSLLDLFFYFQIFEVF